MKTKSKFKNPSVYLAILLGAAVVLSSCEEILLEKDISDERITLTAPIDNAEFNSTTISFSWGEIENLETYRLQVAKPDFDNALEIVLDTLVVGNSFSHELNIGSYEWRVRGENSGYHTDFTSRSFTIASNDDFENNVVTLLNPVNSLISNEVNQYLSWQDVSGANTYQVQIVNLETSTVLLNQNTASLNLDYSFPEGNFQWKVRAGNGVEQTLFSSRNILIDYTAPATPTITAPANNANVSTSNVTFNWSRVDIPGSVESDSIFVYLDPALSNPVLNSVETSPFEYEISEGTYYWYVKSFDEAGNVGNSSQVFSFTVDN